MREMVIEAVRGLPPEWAVLVVAMLPIVELRGAIPLGIALGLEPAWALLLGLIGNLIPIPFVLLLLEPAIRWFAQTPVVGPLVRWLQRRTQARSGQVHRYGWWGLVLFVAIPLPTTGAWTGAMVGSLMGYRFRGAMAALALGALMAGVVVTVLSLFGMMAFSR